jgi:predicted DNA-binding protein (MmcQ/YjbR family)
MPPFMAAFFAWTGRIAETNMTKSPGEDRRLVLFTKICLALPEATRQRHIDYASFFVRKKIFAYYLDNHHGDGIVAVTCKVLPGDNVALTTTDPGRFYLPAYIGSRGWVALRLDVGEIDWDEVGELAAGSYQLVAPNRLGALIRNT